MVSKNPKISVRKLASIDGIVSKSTIQRCLRKNDMKILKATKKPILNKLHKEHRLVFARFHLKNLTDWTHVIFSDEKRWNMEGPDGYEQNLWVRKDFYKSRVIYYTKICTLTFVKGCIFWHPLKLNIHLNRTGLGQRSKAIGTSK